MTGAVSNFEISEGNRIKYVNKEIVARVPEVNRGAMRKRINSIVDNYAGCDADALSILKYATERKRLDEFARRLERHFNESLDFIDPEVRGAHEGTMIFFLQCYNELGIKNRNIVA